MTIFWGLAAILVILALLFTLPWLLRGGRQAGTDLDTLNTEVVRTQLDDLKTDLDTGRLEPAQYEAARRDLERELLDDLAHPRDDAVAKPPRDGQWAAIVLLVAIPLMAIGLYDAIGTRQIIPLMAQMPSTSPPRGETPPQPSDSRPPDAHSLEEMVEKLAARMQQQPDDPQGWMLLARSYSSMQRFEEAAAAYGNAYRLVGDDPVLLANYADARAMADGGNFSDATGALLVKALELDPENIKALWLAGHWRYEQADYTGAVDYWQRAATLIPAESNDAQVIEKQLNAARQQLGEEAPPPAPVATAAAPEAPPAATSQGTAAAASTIQVTVALDPALADQTSSDDTVFIFARAAQGPRMPLAIVRKQVSDLPVTVTLDDSLAMTPAMVMSKFEQVTVGARVSKTGNAMPQSGDLQGTVSPVPTQGSESIQLTIDSRVP